MTLEEIKTEIHLHEPAINAKLDDSLQLARQQGIRLIEAKKQAKRQRKEWVPWMKALGKPAVRTCQQYMQIAHNEDIPKEIKSINGYLKFWEETKRNVGKGIRSAAIWEAVKANTPDEKNWQVDCIDNRKYKWPMVDHIFTDPPWNEMAHYKWLAEMAKEKLKEGGWLAFQCGDVECWQLFPIFKDFTYRKTLIIVYSQSVLTNYAFLSSFRPILLFSKGKPHWPHPQVSDVMTPSQSVLTKHYHDWQQPLSPFVKWIPALTKAGELIADPFTCTGTIGVACKLTGRRFIGTEEDAKMVAVAKKRISEANPINPE